MMTAHISTMHFEFAARFGNAYGHRRSHGTTILHLSESRKSNVANEEIQIRRIVSHGECELQIARVCQSKISISWSICSPHFHTHICGFNWAGRKERIFQLVHITKISTLRIIFTFVIAALNPAWHEPCLWYPQNTGNREKWRRLWLVIVFITCK